MFGKNHHVFQRELLWMTSDFVDVDSETMNSNHRCSLTEKKRTKRKREIEIEVNFSLTFGDVRLICSIVSDDADGGGYV